jgi:hypothetical protein
MAGYHHTVGLSVGRIGNRLVQVRCAGNIVPLPAAVLLPLEKWRLIGRITYINRQIQGFAFAKRNRIGRDEARPAGAERDIVNGNIVAVAAGGIVAERERNLVVGGRCGKGKTIGAPGGVVGNITGSANILPIDEKSDIRLDMRGGLTGLHHRNQVDRHLIQRIGANGDGFLVKKSGGKRGIYHHHIAV